MSRRKLQSDQSGFTLIELLIVMVITGILSTSVFVFFNTAMTQYFGLQKEASIFADLARQSQRTANVIRGMTDVTQASSNEITGYTYFYPSDAYVSLVRYYKSAAGDILYADVTPMTSNPPLGTPITAQKKTYTIIDSLYVTTAPLFSYLDAANNTLTMPISDLRSIKGVRVTLAGQTARKNASQTISLEVSLRNRKTNL